MRWIVFKNLRELPQIFYINQKIKYAEGKIEKELKELTIM